MTEVVKRYGTPKAEVTIPDDNKKEGPEVPSSNEVWGNPEDGIEDGIEDYDSEEYLTTDAVADIQDIIENVRDLPGGTLAIGKLNGAIEKLLNP